MLGYDTRGEKCEKAESVREEKAVPLRHGTTFSVGGEQKVRESVCARERERERVETTRK